VQAAKPAGLLGDQVAAAAGQQPDLQVQFAGRLDGAQVGSGADLVGDHPGIAGVAFVLAAAGGLAGSVDGQARDVDQLQAGRQQHRLAQAGHPTDHVQADYRPLVSLPQLVDQRLERGRVVVHPPVPQHPAGIVDCTGPVDFLGDVDSDPDAHAILPPTLLRFPLPFLAGIALHSDESQSLISGPGRAAGQGTCHRSHQGQPA
jgi:hypothetical protein